MSSIRPYHGANGTSYQITVSMGRTADGRQIIRTTTYRPKEKTPAAIRREVASFAAEYEKQCREAGNPEARKNADAARTLGEYVKNTWSAYIKTSITEAQALNYEQLLKNHIIPYLGKKTLGGISRSDIQDIISKMNGAGYSASTVRNTITALSSVLGYAYDMQIIPENPCRFVRLPPLPRKTGLDYWTAEECGLFLNYMDNTFYPDDIRYQLVVYFYILIYGSFRRSEVTALRWTDLDFSNNSVSISRSLMKTSHGITEKPPKTDAGIRTIILPHVVFDRARMLQERRRDKTGYIFVQKNGERMYMTTPTLEFTRLVSGYNREHENCPLPKIRLHDLRHTGVTLMIASGVDIETISRRVGHSRTSITLDVYGSAIRSLDKTASDALERALENANEKL